MLLEIHGEGNDIATPTVNQFENIEPSREGVAATAVAKERETWFEIFLKRKARSILIGTDGQRRGIRSCEPRIPPVARLVPPGERTQGV